MSSFRIAGSQLTGTYALPVTGPRRDTPPSPGSRAGAVDRGGAVFATTALAPSAPLGSRQVAREPDRRQAPPAPDFGPNVRVFDPATPAAEIQAALDAAARQQATGEPGAGRHAFLFTPGRYDVDLRLGPRTSVAGLGLSPDDVTVHGAVRSVRVEGGPRPGGSDGIPAGSWRSGENLALVPDGGVVRWTASPSAPLRRVHVRGSLHLLPRQGGLAGDGFLADCVVDGHLVGAPQQQLPTRRGEVPHQVRTGATDGPARSFAGPAPYTGTELPTATAGREKPFLYLDATGRYRVFLPALRREASGASWNGGHTPGRSVPIEQFFVAGPSDPVHILNKALAQGKHLLLTPGVYRPAGALRVKWGGTVVLGLGFATLVAAAGAAALRVDDVRGVRIAGLLLDAGVAGSGALLEVGTGRRRRSDPQDPTSVQDVFFRADGAGPGRTGGALVVNSDDVLLDNVLAWPPCHGGDTGSAAPRATTPATTPAPVGSCPISPVLVGD